MRTAFTSVNAERHEVGLVRHRIQARDANRSITLREAIAALAARCIANAA